MRSRKITAPLIALGLCAGLLGCVEDSGAPGTSDNSPLPQAGLIPPAPEDCRPAKGESAFWLEFRAPADVEEGPRMAELVVRHPKGVQPEVSGLSALRQAQKALHQRAKGEDRTRLVILSSDNLNPLPSGPLACLKVPEGSELSFVRSQSEFAPAKLEPESGVIELWPVEVKR